ncbi:MAG TPA: TonB-dependent receptor [Candidatus Angelobacter sp.]|nr:TonB-dependent receptor [Candidatus Angelobacter sp.]
MGPARTSLLAFISCGLLVAALFFPVAAMAANEVRGRVMDETGAAIAGAQVVLDFGQTVSNISTDAAGIFLIVPSAPSGKVKVSAPGFSPVVVDWDQSISSLTITLKPSPVSETVVVTGERSPTQMDETAANIVALTPAELNNNAVLTLDDALRQVPGFTLFRRSSSLTANPTTLGASARGVGASGASRVLVLDDGIPLNDAFGGWVFWDRVPRIAIDRAEVLRGGESLYGSSAVGGVVDLVTRQPSTNLITLESSGDSLDGHDVQGVASHQFGKWLLSTTGENFGNDGAFVVASDDRGLVDTPAALSFGSAGVRIDRKLGSAGNAFLSGDLFSEERNNGTVLQINSTHLGALSSGIDTALGKNAFSFRLYGTGEHYHQSFSSIAADRNSEALTRWQTAPSDQIGFSSQWMRPVSVLQISAGVDGRFIDGETDETAFTASVPSSLNAAGGRDNQIGGFAEVSATVTRRLRASAGVRADHWSNEDGFNRVTPFKTNVTTLTPLDSHTETAYTPRVGVVYGLTDQWQLTATAYTAFRAPTLNELYRSFRQGNVLTLANEALQAEHLQGGEAGVRYMRRRVMVSGVFFRENVDDPVGNITLTTTPALITRERQNIGALRTLGGDVDFLMNLPGIQLRAGYEYVHSIVSSFSANPTLVGNFVPQVPAHSGTVTAVYTAPRHWTIIALARAASHQFDEDQNVFPLNAYAELGLSVSKQTGRFTWFAGAANIFDTKIQTAATPIFTYATPRVISGGVRFTTAR